MTSVKCFIYNLGMKNKLYAAMYAEYQKGYSLEEVGKMFGVSRQSVFEGFKAKSRNYKLREKSALPFQTFDGKKFSLRRNGYYSLTWGSRRSMHCYVWEFYNGPIPAGYDIHHKNKDVSDNRIENLELLTKRDRTKGHGVFERYNKTRTK